MGLAADPAAETQADPSQSQEGASDLQADLQIQAASQAAGTQAGVQIPADESLAVLHTQPDSAAAVAVIQTGEAAKAH